MILYYNIILYCCDSVGIILNRPAVIKKRIIIDDTLIETIQNGKFYIYDVIIYYYSVKYTIRFLLLLRRRVRCILFYLKI